MLHQTVYFYPLAGIIITEQIARAVLLNPLPVSVTCLAGFPIPIEQYKEEIILNSQATCVRSAISNLVALIIYWEKMIYISSREVNGIIKRAVKTSEFVERCLPPDMRRSVYCFKES